MFKKMLLITSILFSFISHANTVIDLYGADIVMSKQIIKNYGKRIGHLEDELLKFMLYPQTKKNEDLLTKVLIDRESLLDKIKKKYALSYIDLDTIYYPEYKTYYTTIEVVQKSQSERLKFINNTRRQVQQKNPHPIDLVTKMIQFNERMFDLAINKKITPRDEDCPNYHCLPDLDDPQLKSWLHELQANALLNKELILRTLANDQLPKRQAAAAFLVGFFNDPNEIISTLIPSVRNKDVEVRNNSMRVIGATMEKAKITKIDVEPFLNLLNSPYNVDRNKALLILSSACKNSQSQIIIKVKAKDKLVNLLELKQPNNHNKAYTILKSISGKSYGEHDFKAWQAWAKKA